MQDSKYLQTKSESVSNANNKTVQNKAITLEDNRPSKILQKKANNTGLSDNLKSGIENLSGHSMDDVKVHYNSDKPAQLNAHAYAQGNQIHIASGQEKHLPHEAWHVVQQKQGRVKPTMQMKGKVDVNDDAGLEKEADVMGRKALSRTNNKEGSLVQTKAAKIIQRQKILVQVTGITHLVKAIGMSIYEGSEYLEVSHGTEIEIENTEKLRSRRGPNQESFDETDKTAPHFYRWFKVKSVNGINIPENIYIRDDAFRVENLEHLGTKPSKISGFQRERQSLDGTTKLNQIYPPDKNPELHSTSLIKYYESIQMLLKNQGAVHQALLYLETSARVFAKKGLRPTQALNIALHIMESKWMNAGFIDLRENPKEKQLKSTNKPNASRRQVVQEKDAIAFQDQFLKGVVQQVVPFKDVGAPLPHGEYAHRIQWYIIAYYYLSKWHPKMLHQLYQTAGNPKYVTLLIQPKLDFDPYRSLWDYVVDLRRQEAPEVVPDTEKAYAASPVMITSDLLGFGIKEKKPVAGSLSKDFPLISSAIANRRRKRVLENKRKLALQGKGTQLTIEEEKELDPKNGYEARQLWLNKMMPDQFL